MRTTMTGADWTILGTLSAIWGSSFLFYRVLALELPPFTTVLGRVAIGALGLLVICWLRGVTIRVPRAQWGRFVVLGVLNGIAPFTLFAWGEQRVEGGTAAILNAMTPAFTAIVTGLILRTEALTANKLIGVGFGFLGVATLIGPGALLGQDLLGELACLTASMCYAFGVPYGRRITGVAPPSMAVGQMVASTVVLLPVVIVLDQPWTLSPPSAAGWTSLLGLALLCTSVAYLFFFKLLERVGATNLTLVTLLVPVSAVILGAIFLNEEIHPRALGGMALIALGLAAIDGRLWKRITRSAAVPVPPPPARGGPR